MAAGFRGLFGGWFGGLGSGQGIANLLNRRQHRLYKAAKDLYRPSNPIAAGSKEVQGVTWSLAYVDVPCLMVQTPNIDDPNVAGRLKRATIFTTDQLRFAAGQEIGDGWFSVDRTILRDGSPGPLWGQVHRMQGAPRVVPAYGRRHGNFQELEAMVEEKPPKGVG